MKQLSVSRQQAFTLLELMLAVTLTSLLMLGVGGAYVTIKGTASQVNALENTQEVLKGLYDTLNYATKRASSIELLSASEIQLSYMNESGSQLACDGSSQLNTFTETFSLKSNQLQCRINNSEPTIVLLTGIERLSFGVQQNTSGNINALLTVVVTPLGLPEIYRVTGYTTPAVRLDFALKSIILQWAT